jgi:predicted PurR-regulated permease PerM
MYYSMKRRGDIMNVVSLILSIIALVLAALALNKVGGYKNLPDQLEKVREKAAEALSKVEESLRPEERKGAQGAKK